MEKDPASYGLYSKCQTPPSVSTTNGYSNVMSAVWVPEAGNPLDEEHSAGVVEDPLGGTPDLVGKHLEGARVDNYPRLPEHFSLMNHENRRQEQGVQRDSCLGEREHNPSTYNISAAPSEFINRGLTQPISGEPPIPRNCSAGDTSSTSQNMSCSSISSEHESRSSDGEPHQNAATSANWKDFLAGLRTGQYEMPDTFRHHLDPDAPLFLPDDHGKSDEESDSSADKAPKPPKKSKVVEAKEALNKGQEHINTKGKLIRARRMGDGCAQKSCRFKCEERITREARTNIFNYFWNLGNHQLQWLFIAMHTTVRTPKQRTKDPESSRRKTSRKYYFRQGTGKIPVCKTMFLQTLDVSDSWVDTAIAKAANGVVVAPDCRGRHSKTTRKTSEEQGRPPKTKRRGRIRAECHISNCPVTPQTSTSSIQDVGMSVQNLPSNNVDNNDVVNNMCDQDDRATTSDFIEPDNAPHGIGANGTKHMSDDIISEGCVPAFSMRDLPAGTLDCLGSALEEGDTDNIMFVPKMDMQIVSDAASDCGSSMSRGYEELEDLEETGCQSESGMNTVSAMSAMSAMRALGVDRVGVGGLLGAAAVPEAFQHHLDPVTLGLRELPNGAVLCLSGDDSEDTSSSSGKKRREPQPSRWRANQCKEALNTGREHINMKGKLIRGRQMGEGCVDSCRFKCRERIDHADRQAIFNYFWSLGDHHLQWVFISQQTRVRAPKQRTQDPQRSRRKTTRSYFFTVGHQEVPVCKTMFLRTLDVSDSWVESAIMKVAEGGGMAVAEDRRGRHRKVTRRIPDVITDSVREHVSLFPAADIPSGPSGHDAGSGPSAAPKGLKRKGEGEGGRLTVAKMHRMYVEWMQQDGRAGLQMATLRQYRDIVAASRKTPVFKQEPEDSQTEDSYQ